VAFSGNTVLEVRQGGSDTNGGGFVTGASGTDWSQQNSPQYAVTDLVTNGGSSVTSASANWGPDVVGNIVYIAGGTASISANWYQVVAWNSATSITLDRANGLVAGTGATLNLGGAMATPGGAGAIVGSQVTPGWRIFIKYSATPYDYAISTVNAAGGIISTTSGMVVQSYDTTRSIYNTDANRATLRAGAGVSGVTMFQGSNYTVHGFDLDGNNQTTSRGSAGPNMVNCRFKNFTNGAASSGWIINCEGTGCSSVTVFQGTCLWCTAYANTTWGFGGSAYFCLSANNTGAGTDGFATGTNANWSGCVAYGNGRHGFVVSAAASVTVTNCISVNNGGWAYQRNSSGLMLLLNCADFNNTTGRMSVSPAAPDMFPVTLTGGPFLNAAVGNFGLNDVAGAGLSCRGTGYPVNLPGLPLTLDRGDIGAVQHQDAGGFIPRIGRKRWPASSWF